MSDSGKLNDFYVDRLDFLKYSLATSVAVWAGASVPRGAGLDEAEAQGLFDTNRVDPSRFPQSVASGDPKPNGIVLWTRVGRANGTIRVGYRVAVDNGRTDAEAFRNPVISGVVETAPGRDHTVKVQLQRSELKPFRKYRYRFYFDGVTSRTGRFKTLPAPDADVEQVKFAYISCQDYTNGYFNAHYHLARERDIDFIVHLGDYTYETVPPEGGNNSFQGGGPEERRFFFPDGGEEELTLKDYRFGYRKYKSDRNLQAVHEKYAFIMIWDDHEFANDAHQTFAPDAGGDQDGNKDFPARREIASRTWFEYNPVGVFYNPAKDPLNEIVLYRSFAFGNLMELVMTDQRLYRDGPPSGNQTTDRYLTPGDGSEEDPDRTMLGDGTRSESGRLRPPQLDYFLQKVTRSPRTWKVWGNEVTVMQLKIANSSIGVEDLPTDGVVSSLEELFGDGFPESPAGQSLSRQFPNGGPPEGVYTTLDQWDGYQAEREKIVRAFRDDRTFRNRPEGVKNFVTITGDIHSYIAGYIKEDFDNRLCSGDNRPVGIELVCPSITSSNLSEIASFGFGVAPPPDVNLFSTAVTTNNPHVKFFNSEQHGYNVVTVTEEALVCEMKSVSVVVPTQENSNSGIQEPDPANTRIRTLREFTVPAYDTDFQGIPVEEPLLVDTTTEATPVPLLCPVPVSTPVNP